MVNDIYFHFNRFPMVSEQVLWHVGHRASLWGARRKQIIT